MGYSTYSACSGLAQSISTVFIRDGSKPELVFQSGSRCGRRNLSTDKWPRRKVTSPIRYIMELDVFMVNVNGRVDYSRLRGWKKPAIHKMYGLGGAFQLRLTRDGAPHVFRRQQRRGSFSADFIYRLVRENMTIGLRASMGFGGCGSIVGLHDRAVAATGLSSTYWIHWTLACLLRKFNIGVGMCRACSANYNCTCVA